MTYNISYKLDIMKPSLLMPGLGSSTGYYTKSMSKYLNNFQVLGHGREGIIGSAAGCVWECVGM